MKIQLKSFVFSTLLSLCIAAPLAATSYQSVPTAGVAGDTGAEVSGNLRVEDPASGAGSNEGLTLSYTDATSPVVFLGASKPLTWWYWVGSAQTNGVFDPESGDLLMGLSPSGVLSPLGISMSSSNNLPFSGLNTDATSIALGYREPVGYHVYGVAQRGSIISSSADDNDTTAYDHSIAFGFETKAFSNAIAFGYRSRASGQSLAIGERAFSLGGNSIAGGEYPNASGENSVAFGHFSSASAANSIAVGFGAITQGENSVSMGNKTYSNGRNSIALGVWVDTDAADSVAVGSRNLNLRRDGTAPDPLNPLPEDPLFQVGNGHSDNPAAEGIRSNALTVYRDGVIEMVKQGDLSMGPFVAQ